MVSGLSRIHMFDVHRQGGLCGISALGSCQMPHVTFLIAHHDVRNSSHDLRIKMVRRTLELSTLYPLTDTTERCVQFRTAAKQVHPR
jgi:hypothetical protein